MGHLVSHVCEPGFQITNTLDRPEYTRLSDELIKDIYDGKISKDQIPERLYLETAKMFNLGIKDQIGNYEYSSPKNALTSSLKANIHVFAAAKSLSMALEVRDQLLDQKGKVKPWTNFRRDARRILGPYRTDWLNAEYVTAIGSAQMASKWKDFEEDKELSPNLTYRTVGDDRVSEEHAVLDGLTAAVDDDIWNTIYPPNRFRCRCTVTQEGSEVRRTPSKDAIARVQKAKVPKLFKRNVGKEGLIFTDDIPYIKTMGKRLPKQPTATANYGLRSVVKMYERPAKFPTSNFAKSKEELKEYFEAQIKANPDTDKTGFVLKGPEEMREIHIDKKVQKKLLDSRRLEGTEIDRAILDPDEVWTQIKAGKGQKVNQRVLTGYLKYFRDRAVVVVVETKGNEVKMRSIYSAKQSSVMEDWRKGILEYKK